MQKMQCEMCGSTDIIKQDGVYVCQYCGCKYTPEEAKKLLGTVRIDNTERLANLYQLARRAKDENNTSLAAKYYNQIVVENPNDWEAVFYSTYYTAMECKIGEIATAATTISNNFPMLSGKLSNIPASNQENTFNSNVTINVDTISSDVDVKKLAKEVSNTVMNDYSKYMRKDMMKLTGRNR